MCVGTACGACRRPRSIRLGPDPAVPLEPLRTLTGSEWLELARAARPQLAQWVAPLNPADYQIGLGRLAGEALGRWTGAFRVERWAFWEHGRLMGAVETRSDVFESTDLLRFAVRSEARGRVENALLARGLRSLSHRRATGRCSWSIAAIMPRACSPWKRPGSRSSAT